MKYIILGEKQIKNRIQLRGLLDLLMAHYEWYKPYKLCQIYSHTADASNDTL